MTSDYQPFAISNFRTGFNESLEPWLLPRDAYQSVINAHLYRGVLEKIEGYWLYAKFSNRYTMSLGVPNGTVGPWTVTLDPLPITNNFYVYGTTVLGTSAETFTYMNDGTSPVVNLIGSAGGTGTVNITTGVVSITFNTGPPTNTYSNMFIAWDGLPDVLSAIMGIKQYFANNGSQTVMIFDQKRVGIVIPIISNIVELAVGTQQGITEIPHDYYESALITGDGSTVTFTGTFANTFIVPGSITITQYTGAGVIVGSAGSIKDNTFGKFTGTNVDSTQSFVNYVTGVWKIVFTIAPTSGNVFDFIYDIFGDLFHGSISNFFTLTNYQYYAFFTNSVDRIMYYDGTYIHYLNTNLTTHRITASSGIPAVDISTCLHVFTLRERLLLIGPTLTVAPVGQQVASVYWSTVGKPLDFTDGGDLTASTSEPIRAFGYINTDLILRFASSERVFRYTGDAFSPFRFDSTNNIWDCDASYSAINYDKWFSTLGRPGIVKSDGVNLARNDDAIPDFTDPTRLSQQLPVPFLNQESIQQCYGERFDDIKEGWLCYNSMPTAEVSTIASDHVLAFNYLDSTYAIYNFPLSCLGFGRVINVATWGTITTEWQRMSVNWGEYSIQKGALIDLGGDQFDNVFELNSSNTCTVAGDSTATLVPVLMNVISKNFNPFLDDGQLARLGYIDLFVSAYNTSTLRVQFYVNDQLFIDGSGNPAGYYQENTLTFTTTDAMSPSTNQTKVWKRIYVGAVGKSHTIRFYQNIADFSDNIEQPIFIHAMVLYMKPAGRVFN